MRSRIALAVVALLSLACTRGSGVSGSETRTVEAFTAIDVHNAITVTVDVGRDLHVEVTGDDNVVPKVRTQVEDQTLHIDLPGSVSTELPLTVKIETPSLVELDLAGASIAAVRGLSGDRFDVEVSGASTADLTGQVDTLEADLSGASTLRAATLSAKSANVESSGASTAEVHVTENLDADASGASKIRYHGQPGNVHVEDSGASKVEPAG